MEVSVVLELVELVSVLAFGAVVEPCPVSGDVPVLVELFVTSPFGWVPVFDEVELFAAPGLEGAVEVESPLGSDEPRPSQLKRAMAIQPKNERAHSRRVMGRRDATPWKWGAP